MKRILVNNRKILFLAIITMITIIITAISFVGCIQDKPSNNNNNNNPPEEPVVMTVSEAFKNYPNKANSFVNGIVNNVLNDYEKDNIIYVAFDVNDKADTTMNDLTVYLGVKKGETERAFVTKECTFNSVNAKDIADGKAEVSNLSIKTIDACN